MKKNWSKIIVIILLILIVVIVIIKKSNQNKSITKSPVIKTDTLSQDTTSVTPGAICETLPEEIKPALKSENAKLEQNVLATVNESKIFKDYLNTRFQALPEQYKTEFKNDQEGFLDQMIIRELLYQEADKKQFTKDLNNINDAEQKKDKAIEKLITDISQKIQIPETEIKAFYDDNQSNMKGATYEQVKSDIQQYLIQQKQQSVISQFIENLKQNAKIVKNEQLVQEQNALAAKNKLEQTRYEAEQRISQAKGEAEAIKIQAQAVNSQGGRDYVELQRISKWNGQYPMFMGSGASPIVDMRSVTGYYATNSSY
jgi:hypothetical protein